MMTAACRLEYLDAMGIQVWRDRRVEQPQLVDLEPSNESRSCNALLCVGSEQAKVFIISAFPSVQDEQQASPFTGDEARLLMQMTQALGLKNNDLYLINSADCQSAQNDKVDKEHLTRCRNYLIQQIHQVSPSIILVLGVVAANSLLQSSESLATLSKLTQSVDEVIAPIIVCEQLDSLIQQPLAKKQVWSTLLMLKGLLK